MAGIAAARTTNFVMTKIRRIAWASGGLKGQISSRRNPSVRHDEFLACLLDSGRDYEQNLGKYG
jgi:hypothetical protein